MTFTPSSRAHAAAALLIIAGTAGGASARQDTAPAPHFVVDDGELDETGRFRAALDAGYTSLAWAVGDDKDNAQQWRFQIDRARDATFDGPESRDVGTDTQTFLSGLEDGDHYFRVRARATVDGAWGPWSSAVIVPVEHHSLTAAWRLFAAGAVLFGTTVVCIIVGATRGAPEEAEA